MASIHDIGIVWKECNFCDKRFKRGSTLKKHLMYTHNIGVKLIPCKLCDKKFKEKGALKSHQSSVHNINVKLYPCAHCNKSFKQNKILKQHLADKHNIGVKEFRCTHCDSTFKQKGHLKTHLALKHDIGVKLFSCEYCSKEYKRKQALKTHQLYIHDIRVVWKDCYLCSKSYKEQKVLDKHIRDVHDIGDNKCDFCFESRFSSIEYEDNVGTHRICRACHERVMGKASKIEKIWSDYIDENIGTEHLLCSDRSLSQVGGCTRYRPDKLYVGLDLVELDECDERQHLHNNASYACDERRISDIYDENGICGKTMVVIRWNPDRYTPPSEYTYKDLDTRLDIMVKLKLHLRRNPPSDKIHIYYLFYNSDNPYLSINVPHTLIYDQKDFM